MLVHASRRQHKSWHWAPIQQKDGCECLKHCRLPSLVGKLARHRDIMQSLDFGVFLRCQGGSTVQMAAWQQTCVWTGHDAPSQAGESSFFISSTAITTNSLNLWGRYRSQSQVRSWRKNYELSFHLNNSSFFLTTLWNFFCLVMAVQ